MKVRVVVAVTRLETFEMDVSDADLAEWNADGAEVDAYLIEEFIEAGEHWQQELGDPIQGESEDWYDSGIHSLTVVGSTPEGQTP